MSNSYRRTRREREEIIQGIAYSDYEKILLSDRERFFGVFKLKKWTKWFRRIIN